jgi:hypothetical protein
MRPLKRRRRVDRERVERTLTLRLRPRFVLRVINRFQKVVGFDRAMALASGALTAMIPRTIVAGAVTSELGGKDTAERMIERDELTGGGAEAVEDVFAPPSGASTSIGIIGFLFLMVAVVSFTRGLQRLFEQTWELDPLSVRIGSAAAGRKIDDELGRIRRGERPADDEVRRQWDQVTAEARSRWQTLGEQIQERRRKRHEGR